MRRLGKRNIVQLRLGWPPRKPLTPSGPPVSLVFRIGSIKLLR